MILKLYTHIFVVIDNGCFFGMQDTSEIKRRTIWTDAV